MLLKPTYLLLLAAGLQLATAAPKPQIDLPTSSVSIDTLVITSSPPEATTSVPTTFNDACAQLASFVRTNNGTNATGVVVPAKTAWDCLQAVPFDSNTAESWVKSLRPYVRWQSTLAYLKNPPSGYRSPAIDINGELDNITANARNGRYRNQYEFEFAIYNTFARSYDGHMTYLPNLVNAIVSFSRPLALVAVSPDGTQLPKSFVYRDVLLSYNNTGFQPSAVTRINGQEVNAYVDEFSLNSPLHDPDARWNNVFLGLAGVSLGAIGTGPGSFSGGGRGDLIYPNATTTLLFENGTTTTYNNTARLLIPFSNITSAQDLYQRYVNLAQIPRQSTTSPKRNIPAPGFPSPVIRQEFNLVGGYYLNGSGYKDVAVLSLPSFQGVIGAVNTTLNFLDRAKADGKTKLVIDLSANGGGAIAYGLIVFAKLFPNIFPYLGTRYRATETFDIIGRTISAWANGSAEAKNFTVGLDRTLENAFLSFSPFIYGSDVDQDYKPFPNWQAKFGPHQFNDDNFTSIIRWNFSQPGVRINFAAINNSTQPLFDPQNIILLTDGYCSSTCSNFVETMTTQAGVKTVTVGGRPNNSSMQVVGGTRGANVLSWANILTYANLTYAQVQRTGTLGDVGNLYLNTEIGEYLGALGSDPLQFLKRGGYANGINVRDNIRRNDTSQTPLQFIYQAADCRIYWTKDMTVDITALWKEVVDVTWGDGECIAGGIQSGSTRRVKRSTMERMERRRLQQRSISSAEFEALAESVNLITDHNVMVENGEVVLD